jgi:hypothetical protein
MISSVRVCIRAIVPQLVGNEDLAPAVALNSAGINISRAVGISRAPATPRTLPPERFGSAILVGLRHVRYNPDSK